MCKNLKSRDNSLQVRRLGLPVSTAGDMGLPLIGELRPGRPHNTARRINKQKTLKNR